jgi:type II secretory pathway pseudopilin PulG
MFDERATAARQMSVCAPSAATQRVGGTLAELIVVLTIMSIVLGYAVVRIAAAADRTAVRAAVADVVTTFATARESAIMRRAPVAVLIDTAASRLRLASGDSLLGSRDFGAIYGVRLRSSRDSMAYDARGAGIGAANLSLVAQRRGAAETVFVSRLGRVRH